MISTTGPRNTGSEEQFHAGVVSKPKATGVPLSWEQEQIWLHAMQFPELPLYTETLTILYHGELNVGALEHSFDELCQRHEILRSVIEEHNGIPHSVVKEARPVNIDFFDLAGETGDAREEQVRTLLSQCSMRPFVLDRGPLLSAFAVRYGSEDTRIFLTLQHLIFDGASLRQILLPELITLYEDRSAQAASRLSAPKMQYGEYVSWQWDHAVPAKDAAMAFWQRKLANVSPLSLPTDRPHTPHMSRKGAVHFFSFDEALTQAVLQTSRQHRTTAFSVLLGSFVALLGRYAETQDVTIGTVYGGRPSTELESVMGCFLNILLLRTDLTGDPTFSALMARVREVTLEALENSAAPFHEVVRQILPTSLGTAAGESPVQAVFSFQPPSPVLPPEWDLDVFSVFNGCAKFDLHLEVEQRHGVFGGRLMYSSELFDAETIESMVKHWLRLLQAATLEPEKSIWKLPLLSADEQNWLLHGVNPDRRAVPELCVHDLFVQKAAEAPESIAVRCQGQNLTYKQLEHWSAGIAHRLQDRGAGSGSVIALMVERSPAMLACLLGILRAGAAYVPLDPTYPAARLEHMMRASEASLLLTQSHLISRLRADHPPVLDIAEFSAEGPSGSMIRPTGPLHAVQLSDSAYILFTSVSTGVPKGVEIPHSALTNLLSSMRETPGITAEDSLLAVTSISFDIAALELFLPLIEGACVELATVEEAADPVLLANKLAQRGATIMQATPATWRMLVDYGWKPVLPLKILCGGEALPLSLAEQLLQRSDSVWNMYGPTETTIWSACIRLRAGAAVVPLGDPVMNTALYVLDAREMLVPAGVRGELYIGGAGLAKGYYGQPELTSARFPVISLTDDLNVRLYRTGDRVKRLRNGSLQFLGRTDRQIKLHGFRIELSEIEHVLNSLPGVREGAVVLGHHASRGDMLAAYVFPKAGTSLRAEELRAGLAKQLPGSMQPSMLRILDEVPLTLNGKLDRSRLPGVEVEQESRAFQPPRPGIEQTLASIWCDVLDLKSLGRRDNFFDLGGRSLEAVRCLSFANRALGTTITFASFIQGPTVAQLASVIQEGSIPRVQLLKRGSSAIKRLLWIGAEPWLTRFAAHLADDITLYTITPDVGLLTDGSIEGMADQILPHVRDLQTEGPCLLGGFCLRSLLAFEIASRLGEEGAVVGLLVLGDLYAMGHRPQWNRTQRVIRRFHREGWNLFSILRSPSGQRLRELRRLLSSWRRLLGRNSGDADTPDELLQALYVAEPDYHLTAFPGQVLFLESGESRLLGGSTVRTWHEFIGDAEVLRYPGIHENIFNESHLSVFAKKIEGAMERALSNCAARHHGVAAERSCQ